MKYRDFVFRGEEMATIGSRKVTSTVVNHEGKDLVIDFVGGLAKVPKEVKKFLLGRSPELYFDPRVAAENSDVKFNNDYEAISYYISKIKEGGSPAQLCSILKNEYETLQGELMSGKYNAKQTAVPEKKEVVEKKSKKERREEKRTREGKEELDGDEKDILGDEDSDEDVNSDDDEGKKK